MTSAVLAFVLIFAASNALPPKRRYSVELPDHDRNLPVHGRLVEFHMKEDSEVNVKKNVTTLTDKSGKTIVKSQEAVFKGDHNISEARAYTKVVEEDSRFTASAGASASALDGLARAESMAEFQAGIARLEAVAGAKVSALGGLAYAEASASKKIDIFGYRGKVAKILHVGPFGYVVEYETEVSIFRLAFMCSATAVVGTKDTNYELPGGVSCPGIDIGLDREKFTVGTIVDIPDDGSYGARLGCHITLCYGECINLKVCENCA